MADKINIGFSHEIIIGLIGGIGVDFDKIAKYLKKEFDKAGYNTCYLTISDHFDKKLIKSSTYFEEIYKKMQFGSFKRKDEEDSAYWARQTIKNIFIERFKEPQKKRVFIIRSLKTKEELELFNDVYGRNFVAISIYLDETKRKDKLTNKIKNNNTETIEKLGNNLKIFNRKIESKDIMLQDLLKKIKTQKTEAINDLLSEFLIDKDKNETDSTFEKYGQKLENCFSFGHYFIDENRTPKKAIRRLVEILFSHPFAEPTIEECSMFYAQSAAYRSLDLDRQVGAAIVNTDDELISIGFNDVSKVGGGHFGPSDIKRNDHRDHKKGRDFNEIKLDKISDGILQKLRLQGLEKKKIIKDEIKIITEFKRSTHAEMSALLDAARRGISVKGCTLYVNTYPCHNCAKHIIAAGISSVVFLHPYPKSEAEKMFEKMIIHSSKKDKHTVNFKPFEGLAPNRFMYAFQNDKKTRQNKKEEEFNGTPIKWSLTKTSKSKFLENRLAHSYISREYCAINNKEKSKDAKIATGNINYFINKIYQHISKQHKLKNKILNSHATSKARVSKQQKMR